MPDDLTRRTLLANERTYLAWWRTGLTALTVALASARLVPELTNVHHRWPYTLIGAGFAVLGVLCVGYADRRRRAVDRAVRAGTFADPEALMLRILTYGGCLLGLAMLVVIVTDG